MDKKRGQRAADDLVAKARAETLAGNALLPQTIGQACAATGTAWGHVSSGCIFSGAKVSIGNQTRVEKDLTRPDLRKLVEQSAAAIHGYTETDEPNFSFRSPPCSFYSGAKALGEEAILLDDDAGIRELLARSTEHLQRKLSPLCAFTSCRGVSALHICAEFNSTRCARVLLENGACCQLDEAAVLKEAQRAAQRLAERCGTEKLLEKRARWRPASLA